MRSRLLAAVLGSFIVFTGTPELSARRAGPTVLMIHGLELKAPVFVVIRNQDDAIKYLSFWCNVSPGPFPQIEARHLAHRPFYNISVFWGLYPLPDEAGLAALLKDLKPENATQQGRLYVSTGGVGAASVSTDYRQLDQGAGPPLYKYPIPVPADVSAFKLGRWLSDADVAAAEKLGVKLRR